MCFCTDFYFFFFIIKDNSNAYSTVISAVGIVAYLSYSSPEIWSSHWRSSTQVGRYSVKLVPLIESSGWSSAACFLRTWRGRRSPLATWSDLVSLVRELADNPKWELEIHWREVIQKTPPEPPAQTPHSHSTPGWLYPGRGESSSFSSYPRSHNKCWQTLLSICTTGQRGSWNPVYLPWFRLY